jgi:hypothetical protein
LLRFLAAARDLLKSEHPQLDPLRLPLRPVPSSDVGIGERQVWPVCRRNAELMAAAGDCGSRQCNPRLGHAPAIFGAKGVSGHAAYAPARNTALARGHGPRYGDLDSPSGGLLLSAWLTSIVFCASNGCRPLLIASATFFPGRHRPWRGRVVRRLVTGGPCQDCGHAQLRADASNSPLSATDVLYASPGVSRFPDCHRRKPPMSIRAPQTRKPMSQ